MLTPLQEHAVRNMILQSRMNPIAPESMLRNLLINQLTRSREAEGGRAGQAPGRGAQTAGEFAATEIGKMDKSALSAFGYDAARGIAAGNLFGGLVSNPMSSVVGRIANAAFGRPSEFDAIDESQLGGILGTNPAGARAALGSINTLGQMDPTTRESVMGALGTLGTKGGFSGIEGMANRAAYEGEERNAQTRSVGEREGILGALDSLAEKLGGLLGGLFGGGDPGKSQGPGPGIGGYSHDDPGWSDTPGMGGPKGDTTSGRNPGGPGADDGSGMSLALGGALNFTHPTKLTVGDAGDELGIFVPDYMYQPGMQGNEEQVRRALMIALMRLNGGFNGRNG